VRYNGEGFPPLWVRTMEFFSIKGYSKEKSFTLYPTCRRLSSIVSYNGRDFPPLWDTTEEVFLRCEIQWRRFSSFVEYNGGGFFHCGDARETNDTVQDDIFKFLVSPITFK
jgi:hypothetical protein